MPLLRPKDHWKMASFLRTISASLTPNLSSVDLSSTKERPDGFLTATAHGALFAQTKSDVDGEECLHDCESCTIHLPRKFDIDEEDKLYGNINGWERHLIVATGKTDWVRDVADEKDSVMEAMGKHAKDVEGGNLMLSASNIPPPNEHDDPYGADRPTSVLLLPAFQFIDNVTPNAVPDLIKSVINPAPTNTTSLPPHHVSNGTQTPPADTPTPLPATLTPRPCPHKYLILMCSQATRDARCGQSAPLLRREIERHLRPLGLYRDIGDERPGGVGIYFISHVGGHKYSANMLVYRKGEGGRTVPEQMAEGKGREGWDGEAAQCIWLARVKPEDCENIVRFTVLQGKVVKPERQLRGGFDRERGVVSW